jgi:acetyl esterase/lipase
VVKIAPYGTWDSPITAAVAATAFRERRWVGRHAGFLWWTETRAEEGGRLALMRCASHGGAPEEVLAAPWNVRNRVHEYGGRPWVGLDAGIAFTNWADQRVYLLEVDTGAEPVPISPVPDKQHGVRYSDLSAGPNGFVWCVRETSTGDWPTDIRRDLVALPVTGEAAAVRVLTASHHFMTGPKVSPDGRQAAWIGWEHPRMPWDGTELCVAEITAGGVFGPHRVIAGGPAESVCQVEWDGADAVLALTDPHGWWNLHRIGLDGGSVNLAPCQQELGGPMWMLGFRWFAPLGGGRHAILRSGGLAVLDERSGTVTDVDTDFAVWGADISASDGVVLCTAGGPTRPNAVVELDLSSGTVTERSTPPGSPPDERYLPVPEERIFTDHNGQSIPAYVYLPHNPEFSGPPESPPPFVVHAHGGPTGKFAPTLNLDIALLTSRGIGVVAVNYGGSAGYGREFRELLNEQWGVVDVRDCATVATALAKDGVADGERLGIRGGSAGGWTAAASMTTVDTYRCGTIMFPILDLTGWTGDGGETHDFESMYVQGLVGTLPEHTDRYLERSPMNHIDKLAGPVLLLQGLDDPVCPPEQANRFVAALDGTGVLHAYLAFAGEQHGFRRAESIEAALNAELSFYGQVFGFIPEGIPVLELLA